MAELPKKAKVVIIGGGVIGCSIAYHLTKIGWDDVVLLERKQLTSGTTWHAAGLVGQLRPSINMTKLAKYTGELYRGLEAETGQATGYRQCGSISMATNLERFEELKRSASMAKVFDLPVHVVTPEEIKGLANIVNVDDVVGGIHIPSDGYANAVDITQALAKGARTGGAKIFENTKVTKIRHNGDRVTGVDTAEGSIDADYVGQWLAQFVPCFQVVGIHDDDKREKLCQATTSHRRKHRFCYFCHCDSRTIRFGEFIALSFLFRENDSCNHSLFCPIRYRPCRSYRKYKPFRIPLRIWNAFSRYYRTRPPP